MDNKTHGTIAAPDQLHEERFDNPMCGNAIWFTLFSSDRTLTSGMSAGVMVLPPNGGHLEPHQHMQAEIYFVAAGGGTLTINGVATEITAGAAAFIPGDAVHSLRNDHQDELRIFYVFPTDSFQEVAYRFERF